ncbi:MAG: hypothetical protein AAFQ94_26740 [Bacteroidota bacterium]
MKLNTGTLLIFLTVFTLFSSGCQSLKNKARYEQCEFRISGVNRLAIAGVEMLNKRAFKDFTTNEGLTLAYQVKQQKLVTNLGLSLQVRNPNDEAAQLRGVHYVLVIDGKEIINSEINSTVNILPKGSSAFTLSSRFDLIKAAKDTGYDTLLKLALGLTQGSNQPVNFDLYFRPKVYINDKKVKYKDFIKLSSQYQNGIVK